MSLHWVLVCKLPRLGAKFVLKTAIPAKAEWCFDQKRKKHVFSVWQYRPFATETKEMSSNLKSSCLQKGNGASMGELVIVIKLLLAEKGVEETYLKSKL